MKHKSLLMLGVSAMMLTSCETEIINDFGPKPEAGTNSTELTVVGSVDGIAQSRATDSSWEDGDAIGITSSELLSNAKFTTDGSGTFTGEEGNVYFPDSYTHTFNAYYPYSDAVTNGLISFTVSGEANYNSQKAYDFMFASSSAGLKNPVLSLTFRHKMARLIINVSTSTEDGFSADDVFGTDGDANSSVGSFSSLYYSGIFDTSTGVVSPSSKSAEMIMSDAIDNADTHTRTYVVYVPTQQKCKYKHTFNKGASNEQNYSVSLGTGVWQAGTSYTYNITIKKNSMDVTSSMTITDWTDNGSEDYNAVM